MKIVNCTHPLGGRGNYYLSLAYMNRLGEKENFFYGRLINMLVKINKIKNGWIF